MAEIETGISQSDNIVKSAPKQTLNVYPHNNTSTKVNKPTCSVPKSKIETKQLPSTTIRQTKISDILRPSTSKLVTSSITESIKRPNDWSIESHSLAVEQSSGKRLASSPVHAQPKRSSIEPHIPEEIWDNMDMDVDDSNPLIKVLKFASVVKNSKIQVKQNKWICSGIVVDESKYEVEFSSDVSCKFLITHVLTHTPYQTFLVVCALKVSVHTFNMTIWHQLWVRQSITHIYYKSVYNIIHKNQVHIYFPRNIIKYSIIYIFGNIYFYGYLNIFNIRLEIRFNVLYKSYVKLNFLIKKN